VSKVAQQAVEEKARDTTSPKRWWVAGLLSFGMVNAYFDRVALTIALPVMTQSFDLSDTQKGLALSAFFWSYTVLQIPSGKLVDRFGVRTPYIIGYVLWSLASAGTALSTSLVFLITVRLLLGAGESVVTPSSMRYISMHFAEKQRGKAVGIYMTGTKLGPALGLPLAGYLIAQYGWQAMFLIMGLGGLVFLVPWMAWVKKDDIAALGREEREALEPETRKERIPLTKVLASPVMWGVIIGTYCYMYFVYYCMTWMPDYLMRVHGMNIKESSAFTGASFGGMAVMIWVGGWAADYFIGRGHDPVNVRKLFTILGFACAATQTISVFTDNVEAKLFFTAFALCGLGLATANYWALTQTLIPGGSIAGVAGVQNTAANLAGATAAGLTGWLVDITGSFDAPIYSVGFWLLIGIAAYAFLVKPKYAPQGAPG
jgi:MFS family permease